MMAYAHTYGGPSLFVTFVLCVVLPLFYFAVIRRWCSRRWTRVAVVLTLGLGAWLIAYADVLWIAWRAQRLCERGAGLRVAETVEAKGFLGSAAIETWGRDGFEFVETEDRFGGRRFRYLMRDGRPTRIPVDALASRHEYALTGRAIGKRFYRNSFVVREISGGRVLGEFVYFNIYPGWLDRLLIAALGLHWSPPMCVGDAPAGEEPLEAHRKALIRAVLRPPGRASYRSSPAQ